MALNMVKSHLLNRFTPATQRPDRGHIVELDSLRGIAALIVVFGHFMGGWLEASPAHWVVYILYVPVLMKLDSAVMLFFVLSGFVLTLPMLSAKKQSYPAYVVRRVCRIYLPYVGALLIAMACCWRFHGLDMYGPNFQSMWRSAPSWPVFAHHLTFLGRYNIFAFDPPMWSLVHEMRISLIFPLLCLISLRLRPWPAFLIAASFPVACRLVGTLNIFPYYGENWPAANKIFWADTLGYCGVFLVGSLLARYREEIVRWLSALPVALNGLIAVAAIALYQYSDLLHVPRAMRPFAAGVGAGYFVMLALVPGGWLSRLLRLSPLRFLGRISYSLYLIHVPIVMLMAIAIWGTKINAGAMLVPYLVVTLSVAAVFYRFVEVPSIALGKAITAKWRLRATADAGIGVVTEPVA